MLSSTEAEASAGVGKPEDSLSRTSRSGLSATGEPATNNNESDFFFYVSVRHDPDEKRLVFPSGTPVTQAWF